MSWTSCGRCCFRSTQCAASWRTLSASATAAVRTCFSRASSASARSRSLRRFCFSNRSSSAMPRIGQEVVVDFVEGDVDQPIIVGNVYNADTMPPWTMPDGKNICGAKTRSTPGGSSDNYNEMSFDDTTGSELVNMQAEKDSTALIKHDEKHTVGNDQFITVQNGVQITRILGGGDHVP